MLLLRSVGCVICNKTYSEAELREARAELDKFDVACRAIYGEEWPAEMSFRSLGAKIKDMQSLVKSSLADQAKRSILA